MNKISINDCITEFPNDFIRWFNGFILGEYHFVSVSDVKDILGLKTNYIDMRYGWTRPISIYDFVSIEERGCIYWRLNLPKPILL